MVHTQSGTRLGLTLSLPWGITDSRSQESLDSLGTRSQLRSPCSPSWLPALTPHPSNCMRTPS